MLVYHSNYCKHFSCIECELHDNLVKSCPFMLSCIVRNGIDMVLWRISTGNWITIANLERAVTGINIGADGTNSGNS